MKAFTLYEMIITLFVMTILFSIAFKSPVFHEKIYYLNQATKKLSDALHLAQDAALSNNKINDEKICAVGIKFNTSSYEGVAFYAPTEDCEAYFNNHKEEFVRINAFLQQDGSISAVKNNLQLFEQFKGTLLVDNCSRSIKDYKILFLNPYGEVIFFDSVNKEISSDSLLICLKYSDESKQIKINKFGQITTE